MGKGKISVLFVSFIFIISCILTSKMAKADEPIVTKTISGIISYNIGENGENNAKKVTKVLGNYPVILVYKDVNNKTKSIPVITNSSGYYTTVINSSVKISAVWFEIMSENKSCSVYRKFKLINNKPYSYKSNEFPINVKQNTININLKIEDDNVIGALNIARVINNAKDFFFNATGIDTPKIPVYWTYGVGENSFTLTDPAFEPVGNFGFMQLSGEDHDERDESVIVHEYGHWVFGKIRGIGRFMSGSHSSSKEIHSALAYSEGLATFFGQSFLNIDQYVDGGTLKYSIETPPSRFTKGINNEAYVSASLWDVIDSYNNTEQWDNVNKW